MDAKSAYRAPFYPTGEPHHHGQLEKKSRRRVDGARQSRRVQAPFQPPQATICAHGTTGNRSATSAPVALPVTSDQNRTR